MVINWNKVIAIAGLTVIGSVCMVTIKSNEIVAAIVGFVGGVLATNAASKK